MTDRDPDALRDAAELCKRHPERADEDRLKAALDDAEGRSGERWEQARNAILDALGAVRKHGEEVAVDG